MLQPVSFTAIRVPAIQNVVSLGNPAKLANTDLLGGCGTAALSELVGQIAQVISNGLALTINSAMTAINQAVASVTAPLQGFINSASGALLTNLNSMMSALTVGNLPSIASSIGQFAAGVPNMAGCIAAMSNMAAGLSITVPSLPTIFAGVIAGQLNSVLSAVTTDIGNIVSAVSTAVAEGIGAIAGELTSLTSALVNDLATAVSAVTGIINTVMSAVDAALNALTQAISSAIALAEMMLCSEMEEFASFIGSIATPALQAVLPS